MMDILIRPKKQFFMDFRVSRLEAIKDVVNQPVGPDKNTLNKVFRDLSTPSLKDSMASIKSTHDRILELNQSMGITSIQSPSQAIASYTKKYLDPDSSFSNQIDFSV